MQKCSFKICSIQHCVITYNPNLNCVYRQSFFAKRVFRIFDLDNSKTISLSEFREGFNQFCGKSDEDKVRCLFQIYDQNGTTINVTIQLEKLLLINIYVGDGKIQINELRNVLEACTEENGMKFSDIQLDQLAVALFDDARGSGDGSHHARETGLDFEELKTQLFKQPGLLENLSIR